jgi:hypothetical protein
MTARTLRHLASVSVNPAACGRWLAELPPRCAPGIGAPSPLKVLWGVSVVRVIAGSLA